MKKWDFYTTNELKPQGWIKRQLEIQAESLSGNLDKIWSHIYGNAWTVYKNSDQVRDLQSNPAWLDERVLYWLDGFIPLAYLLENEEMIARAQKYIEDILDAQKPDGWMNICEENDIPLYETWILELLSKVLVVYYECSGDERIPEILYKFMKKFYELLESKTIKLFKWGQYRWFEAFIALDFLKKRYDDEWIISLAEILKEQGMDYNTLTHMWKRPINFWGLDTHIVNIVMMLKYEAVYCNVTGAEYTNRAEYLLRILSEFNGTPVGLITGDECLSGKSPIQGTELCAVVEQMYSYEQLFAYTGDYKWAERLELIGFNGLPATFSDDMWAHQYDQLSNQISCEKTLLGRPKFRTNDQNAHIFGFAPNFACCTSNLSQGWPKFVLSSFMHNENTVMSVIPMPSSLKTEDYFVTLNTEYPFENKFVYTAEAKKDFNLRIRIPGFAKNLTINDERVNAYNDVTFEIKAGEKKVITVSYETVPDFVDRPYDLKAVRCGSLVFSVPIEYEQKIDECMCGSLQLKYPYCDYEYIPKSDWNYAYSSFDLELKKNAVSSIPFSSKEPPVTVKAKVQKIAWGYEEGYNTFCAKVPESRFPLTEEQEIELYPYGCAKLRMTELPLI
ncbi:MAG: hypothetical protein E7672_05915 [Ruminococcaceae bacterium]|nr:hypothetical protein [Oscillospiraceae bacterium]